ncbi:MAG: preprotein translocase subunit SecE [Alphaproteobacteria bacterium]
MAQIGVIGQQKVKIGLMRKIIEFGREVEREVKKVTWPTRKEIGVTTLMIFIMAAVAAVFFFFVDWGVSHMIRLILNFN